MIYITGDTHRDFLRIEKFCKRFQTTKDDLLIILGDVGINYYGQSDNELKEYLQTLPITFFCIQGNHEERPENIPTYHLTSKFSGEVFIEDDYPNILFAKDAEIYNLNQNKVLVIGGAYSIDKDFRIKYNHHYFKDEQPSLETKNKVLKKIETNEKVDVILTHTCPYSYLPREAFYAGIDQSTVDQSTEYFLDEVEQKSNYKHWYCGHFHIDKSVNKITFMFEDIKEFK